MADMINSVTFSILKTKEFGFASKNDIHNASSADLIRRRERLQTRIYLMEEELSEVEYELHFRRELGLKEDILMEGADE